MKKHMMTHNYRTNRRCFLKKTSALGGMSIFLTVIPSAVFAQITKPDDSRLITMMLRYQGASGPVLAYLAQPKENKKHPGIVVIHENRGLQPHIKDVARRLALEGFIALAPDGLSPLGGTPDKEEDAISKLQSLDYETTKKDFAAAVNYLKTNPLTTGKVGCTGFCWGGAMTNQVAVKVPGLDAAVPYYGAPPKTEDVSKIKAPMLLHYAENDDRINMGIPQFEQALKEAGIPYQIYIYKGTQHRFNNDTDPDKYNKEAAELAWSRTIKFLKDNLG
jgi:carboxymethylenebutenolidase